MASELIAAGLRLRSLGRLSDAVLALEAAAGAPSVRAKLLLGEWLAERPEHHPSLLRHLDDVVHLYRQRPAGVGLCDAALRALLLASRMRPEQHDVAEALHIAFVHERRAWIAPLVLERVHELAFTDAILFMQTVVTSCKAVEKLSEHVVLFRLVAAHLRLLAVEPTTSDAVSKAANSVHELGPGAPTFLRAYAALLCLLRDFQDAEFGAFQEHLDVLGSIESFPDETVLDGVSVRLVWLHISLIQPLIRLLDGNRLMRRKPGSTPLQMLLEGLQTLDESIETPYHSPIRVFLQASVASAHLIATDLDSASSWIASMLEQRRQTPKHFRVTGDALVLALVAHYCLQMHREKQARQRFIALKNLCLDTQQGLLLFAETMLLLLDVSLHQRESGQDLELEQNYYRSCGARLQQLSKRAEAALDSGAMAGTSTVASGLAFMLAGDEDSLTKAELCLRKGLAVADSAQGSLPMRAITMTLMGVLMAELGHIAASGKIISMARMLVRNFRSPASNITILSILLTLLKKANADASIVASLQAEIIESKRELVQVVLKAKRSEAHEKIFAFDYENFIADGPQTELKSIDTPSAVADDVVLRTPQWTTPTLSCPPTKSNRICSQKRQHL